MRDTTVDDLEALRRQASSVRSAYEPDWYLNLAFFQNNHWVGWNGSHLFRPALPRDRVTLTDNRITPIIEKEIARLTKQKPTYVATPGNSDDTSITAAQLAEQVLDWLWNELGVQQHFYEALKWSRVCGGGFLKTVWDRTLGESTDILVAGDRPLLGADNRPLRANDQLDPAHLAAQLEPLGLTPEAIKSKRISRGDIRVSVCSPFQIFVDPLAAKLADAEWLIEESVLSVDQVEERYGKLLEADTDANPGLVEARFGMGSRAGGYKGVRVNEYWRRPCRDHPNGYRVVWAGKRVLERDEPFDPMPYLMLRGIDVPGRFHPMAIAELLRPLNAELNKRRSQLSENANRIGNPTLLASRTAAMDPDEFERQIGMPGGVVYYDDPGSVPAYLQAPEMPAYVPQSIERIEAAIQEVAGQHEISSAQLPAGVTAASAISLLMEADDTRLGPAATDLALQLAMLGQKQLRLVDEHYDDTRKIALLGDNQAWDIRAFHGRMLHGHTRVNVQQGSLIPQSKAARQAAMMQVLNLFIQNGIAFRERQLARFVRDFDAGGLEHLIVEHNEDEQQVNRENRQLSLGQRLPINSFDNDEAHIAGHQAQMKTSSYAALDDPLKMLYEEHLAEHKARVEAAVAAQQAAEQQPQLEQAAAQQVQASQQLQQSAEQHQQRVGQSEELHAQRLQQQAQPPSQ